MKQLLLSTLVALSGVAASAGEFGITHGKVTGREYITFEGGIGAEDASNLVIFAAMNPNATWISLSSPGGLAKGGYDMSAAISALGLNTYVPYGAACVSACYVAFLGGTEYDIDGVIAAHNAYLPDAGDITINQAVKEGQGLGSYDAWFHLANGFNYGLPNVIAHYTDKDTFVAFTSEDELMEFYVRTEEDNIMDYLSGEAPSKKWLDTHIVESEDLIERSLANFNNDYPDHFEPRN